MSEWPGCWNQTIAASNSVMHLSAFSFCSRTKVSASDPQKTTQKCYHHQLYWLYQNEYFSTMGTMMKALLTPLETSCYNFSMLWFCHKEGGCRWSSSALGWNEMHSVLQEMWHGIGSQELLRCSSLPDGNSCDVGQYILSIPGLSFSKGDLKTTLSQGYFEDLP